MYMYIFAIVLLLGTVLHCTTLFVWDISSLELIIVNFRKTVQNSMIYWIVSRSGSRARQPLSCTNLTGLTTRPFCA